MFCSGHLHSCTSHWENCTYFSARSHFEVTEIKTEMYIYIYMLSALVRISFNTMNLIWTRKERKNENLFYFICCFGPSSSLSVVVSTGRRDAWWWWWWWRGKREQNKASVYMYVQKATWNYSFSFLIADWPKGGKSIENRTIYESKRVRERTGYVLYCERIVLLNFQGRRHKRRQ